MLYFITGSKNKFTEASQILGDLRQLDIDLPEIQSLDSKEIIEAKLTSAFEHHDGPFLVEDVSLTLDCLVGLPGPLIKWFIKTLKPQGIYDLVNKYGIYGATSSVTYGYAKDRQTLSYVSAALRGTIVNPSGDNGFGFDPIFQPEGFDITQADMTIDQKNEVSARRKALEQLMPIL